MRRSRAVLAVVMVNVMTAGWAWAQAAGPSPPSTPVTAGWQDGFVLQTANGDNRLVLGLMVQVDGRFLLDDAQTIPDSFTIRKDSDKSSPSGRRTAGWAGRRGP